MTTLKEHTVQMAAIQWLQALGYTYLRGNTLPRDLKKVVLETELRAFLQRTYSHVPLQAIDEAVLQFTQQQSLDTHQRNREFHIKWSQGVSIAWKDANEKEHATHFYPVNFQHPEANSFICADEVSIVGKNSRRADLVIFINGLPLVLFEFKNPFDAEVGIDNAHRQIGHYVLDIPQLFDFNALCVISDGLEAEHGMYSSALEWFAPWKSEASTDRSVQEKLDTEGAEVPVFRIR